MINVTKNISNADLITHSGSFHADDVMATVILSKYFGNVTVCRTTEIKGKIRKKAVIYDIGDGKFDHHQIGGNGQRDNGVPYASCGLIWKNFGPKVLNGIPNSYFIWKFIDNTLIQSIDAIDNGVMPKADYPAQVMSFSQCIYDFNSTWCMEESSDEKFIEACAFAEIVFDNILKKAIARAEANPIVEEAIEKSKDHIMILDYSVNWQGKLLSSKNKKANDIWFVIYPSNRGVGYTWRAVPTDNRKSTCRKSVPSEWKGLKDEELQKITGIKTAFFCHTKGFTGAALTLEDTIAMVKIAINS